MIIGDSLVLHLKLNNVISNPGMKLEEYIKEQYDYLQSDILIYSFGGNDIKSGIDVNEVFHNYNKLYRGNNETYLIIPPLLNNTIYTEFMTSNILDDDFILLFTWTEHYSTIDDNIHPDIISLEKLKKDIQEILITFKEDEKVQIN
mgnify:FL=1